MGKSIMIRTHNTSSIMTKLVLVDRIRQQPMKTLSFKAVKKIILNNPRITIREIADDVMMMFRSYSSNSTDVLGMKHAAAKIKNSKLLNFEQKQRRMDRFSQKVTNHWCMAMT